MTVYMYRDDPHCGSVQGVSKHRFGNTGAEVFIRGVWWSVNAQLFKDKEGTIATFDIRDWRYPISDRSAYERIEAESAAGDPDQMAITIARKRGCEVDEDVVSREATEALLIVSERYPKEMIRGLVQRGCMSSLLEGLRADVRFWLGHEELAGEYSRDGIADDFAIQMTQGSVHA